MPMGGWLGHGMAFFFFSRTSKQGVGGGEDMNQPASCDLVLKSF